MLKLENLTTGYGNIPILSNLSAVFPEGQVTALIGPNGSGKSTLLKAMAGILPSTGRVLLDDTDLTALSSKERAKQIAYLPQNRPIPEITAQRLVLHGRFPYLGYPRRYRREDYEKANAALETMGISDLSHRLLPTLSGGQRQKVYIAQALAQETPIILLDEPTTYLDISHQLALMAQLRTLSDSGKTVILVLHDLSLALEYAHHIAILHNHQITAQGTPDEIYNSPNIKEAFDITMKKVQTSAGEKFFYHK